MKIAFHSNQLNLRGTEIALYDYAKYNEELLGNESIILSKANAVHHPDVVAKFADKFDVLFYDGIDELEQILENENVDLFYAQKAGSNDGILSKKVKTAIHAVFQEDDPHGDVYAYISGWLGAKFYKPFVPYIVTLPETDEDLREELNIPKDAIVFGRHGGAETFDLKMGQDAIREILKLRDDIYFLFLNTDNFIQHPNVIYLEGNADLIYKVKFINTCDAMIHARIIGETFGLAPAEFSLRNKPVFTYGGPQRESAHLKMLGDKAIKYYDMLDLMRKMDDFKPEPDKDWNAYRDFNPVNVMNKFKQVFID